MRDRRGPRDLLSNEAFASIAERQQSSLHAFLYGMVGQHETAFDLVQDTLYDAWRAAQRGDAPWQVGTAEIDIRRWLFRVAYNNAISHLRRARIIRWETLDERDGDALHSQKVTHSFEDQLAEGEALKAALEQLSPQDAACILLRVVHCFSATEVATMLHISTDAVNQRLTRAKQRLRVAYLQPLTPTEEHHR